MIDLDKADDFAGELAQLMIKYNLAVFIDDVGELHLDVVDDDVVDYYISDLLDNTPRI